MAVVRPGGDITILVTAMTDSEVLEFRGIRLGMEDDPKSSDKELEDAMRVQCDKSPLRLLAPLVQPLWEHTSPGELLVFCPSNYLHQIPLHAIEWPDKVALIHRNPLVHSYSLSLLKYNFIRATTATASRGAATDGTGGSGTAAVFGDIVQEKNFGAGRVAVRQLAALFATSPPFLGALATKSALIEAAPRSTLLHFHTHMGAVDTNPLAHSIMLRDDPRPPTQLMPETIARHPWSALLVGSMGSSKVSRYSDYLRSVHDTCITAGEISHLVELPSPSHVTLIACGGARLRVHPGDEVMGIIPAFMMKGATSAIGTLWNTNDGVGAALTRWFYKFMSEESHKASRSVAHGRGSGGDGIGNMARAFQSAMVALDKEHQCKDPPYWWAGFVFHGWWMYKPPVMSDLGHPWLTNRSAYDFF